MEEKNKNKGLIVVIVILIILVLGLSSYITYDKFLKNDNDIKDNNTKELPTNDNEKNNKDNEENKEDENKVEEGPKEIAFDKAKVNEWLSHTAIGLAYTLDISSTDKGFFYADFDLLKSDTELFDTSNKKFCYAWTKVVFDRTLQYSETTINGEEVTGANTYKYSDVNNTYRNLFGNDIDKTASYKCDDSNFTIKNDLVYGYFWSGWTGEEAVAKINKIIKDNDTYTLSIDMIYDYNQYNPNGSPWAKLELYAPSTVTEYDESMVVAKFEMTLQKVDNNYVIKSLKKVK